MKTLSPITTLRQLRNNSKQLQKMLTNGKFNQLTHKKRQQWLTRVERLKQKLSKLGQFKQVRKAVTGAAMLLSIAFGNTANAQSFGALQTSPFGLGTGNTVTIPTLGDIDDDGDLDMLVGDVYGVQFYENQGDSTTPIFNLVTLNSPFANVAGTYFSMPSFVDIDTDGDLDVFITEYYGTTVYFENIGTPTTPIFSSVQSMPFGLNTYNMAAFIRHNFVDIDGDLDLDIIAGGYGASIYYFENTGTLQNAAFAAPVTNPFGMTGIQTSYYVLPAFTDIDSDGDADMFVTKYGGDIEYFENTGTTTAPAFGGSLTNPFGLTMNTAGSDFIMPLFGDIDDDGDDDLFAGTYNATIIFQENLTIINIAPTSADSSANINQDESFVFDAMNFPFTDLNANDMLAKVKITGLVSNGDFAFASTPVFINQEINIGDLVNLTYQPQTGQYGANFDSFTFEVSDGDDYSATAYTFTFNVNGVPTTTQTTVETIENTDYVFDVADFTFNDPDGGTFDEIQIVTLPNKGVINYNGSPVGSGQVVATSDFANLTFSPDLDETGFPYTDLLFAVGDGNGFSQSNTLFIDVDFPINTKSINDFATIQLMPNPTSETANIRIKTDVTKSATLSVHNIAGQVILNQNIELNGDFNTSIDVRNWAKGMYVIRLQTVDGEIWTEKLIVK